MSVKKFKFVSPGVSVAEIDKSRLPEQSLARGPLLVGRAERGPTMRPIKVQSFSEFVETFGAPIPGGQGGDVWRDGNYTSTTYASYAAQAYLRNNSPVTFIRLVGSLHGSVPEDTTITSGDTKVPGWQLPAHTTKGGGAYGLFLFDSQSLGTVATGTLAAVWYAKDENTIIKLSGTYAHQEAVTSSIGALLRSQGPSREFKLQISSSTGGAAETISFNFDRTSDKFIRKVFNTNPVLTGDLISDTQSKTYWLGETFEGVLDSSSFVGAGGVLDPAKSGTGNTHGVIFVLKNQASTAIDAGIVKRDSSNSKSGWVVCQDLGDSGSFDPTQLQKLFRFVSRNAGEWDSKNLKVSIQDIKFSNNEYEPYGTFTVVLRDVGDNDSGVIIRERYENLSLNPNSNRYISRVIGDKYALWDEQERRLREYGTYDNVSNYIRVEVSTEVESGGDPRWLPAGFYGPPRFKRFTVTTGSIGQVFGGIAADNNALALTASSVTKLASNGSDLIKTMDTGDDNFEGNIVFPKYNLRQSSDDTTLRGSTAAYFGIETRRGQNSRVFDETSLDLSRNKPRGVDNHDADSSTEVSFIFTMDDLSASSDFNNNSTSLDLVYHSGSRKAGTSITAVGLTGGKVTADSSYQGLLDLGFDRFTMPLFGGFDGFDVTEREPLRNSLITGNPTDSDNYVFNTYKRAIDMLQDVEDIDVNLAAVPGLTNAALTTRLIDNCEERGDALAIIDIEGDYTPIYETNSDDEESERLGSVDQAVSSMKQRNINSSYGAAYYPWVLVRDTATTGQVIWMPPSVVALGVIGNSATQSELWFAPAGFNRGGLTDGHSGLTVVGVRQKLSARDRDKLYEQHINPIASFPAEGIVVFGQKTLQLTQSAVDRINVRRLMIFLKKEISFAASRILFDQNVRQTWGRFTSQVTPLLRSVQARFGLTDFKLVLDETTTTPELIDRNILYAKVFVKPARAIEYIALDFVITATGASFEE